MSTAAVSLIEIAAEWRTARRLFPFYSALIREFQLNIPHCKDLEHPVDRSDREVLERIHKWFSDVDLQVQVAQMRQLLQNQRFGEEATLRALLLRHLPQDKSDENLRDKLDYLLVQYFAAVAPHHPHDEEVTSSEVRETLQPVLGHIEVRDFPWVKELDNIAEAVDRCSSLTELLDSGLVELGRQAKRNLGGEYFKPAALIEITRFNFRLRLGFFRLMHSDLHAIRKAVQELESMGVATVDCREAGLGAEEPLATMRTLCHQWKKPFREAYRAGQSFRQLGIVRNVLANAVMTQWAKNARVAAEDQKSNGQSASSVQAVTVSTAPKPASTVHENSFLDNVEQVVESISEQLFASKQKKTVSTVVLGDSKEVLASWEVNAFVRGGDPSCVALQRAVAARCLLAEAAKKVGNGRTNGLVEALEAAHVQAAAIQEHVAKAKETGDIDAAVTLAATAKRLLALIDETEKLKA
jgi:hypothetical protein